MLFQAMHRHGEARIIIFTKGLYFERTFGGVTKYQCGDFIIRPNFFAHDGFSHDSAEFISKSLTPKTAKILVDRYGWNVRRGSISAETLADGDTYAGFWDDFALNSKTSSMTLKVRSNIMSQAAKMLECHKELTLGEIAKTIDRTPSQFSREFQYEFGISPSRYRQEARLQRALTLLFEHKEANSKIAVAAGYYDQSHYCHAFKAFLGKSPDQIRRAFV
jgi:AraC-like DNA-binding protein